MSGKMKNVICILIVSMMLAVSGNIVVSAQNSYIVNESRSVFQTIDSPPYPVRQPAEFEPMEGVLIRYPLGISTSIIAEMAEDVIAYCVVTSEQ
jgi:hypothetical protein